jgi:hypothetical protein
MVSLLCKGSMIGIRVRYDPMTISPVHAEGRTSDIFDVKGYAFC